MSKILARIGAFRNKAVVQSIETESGPQDFRFYPPRMRMLLSGRMREIVEPITQALGTLFAKTSQDASRQQEVSADGKVTTFVQGLNPEVIALRETQRSEALARALRAVLEDNTRYQIGELLADSLREDFSENEGERAKEARKFMDEMDLPTLIEFVKGYFKALAPVLDKSGNSMFSNLQGLVKREVERALGKDSETEVGDEADILDLSSKTSPETRAMEPSAAQI